MIPEKIKDRLEKLTEGKTYYTCICPFHTEKTPSFTIRKDSEKCSCLGCGLEIENMEELVCALIIRYTVHKPHLLKESSCINLKTIIDDLSAENHYEGVLKDVLCFLFATDEVPSTGKILEAFINHSESKFIISQVTLKITEDFGMHYIDSLFETLFELKLPENI